VLHLSLRRGYASAGGGCGLRAGTGVEVRGGDGRWAAAGAVGAATCSSGLNLLVDGEEGVERAIDGGGVREVRHEVGIEDHEVRSLLEQVGVLAASALAEVECLALCEWIEFGFLHRLGSF
jgi:hypothetical protein